MHDLQQVFYFSQSYEFQCVEVLPHEYKYSKGGSGVEAIMVSYHVNSGMHMNTRTHTLTNLLIVPMSLSTMSIQ